MIDILLGYLYLFKYIDIDLTNFIITTIGSYFR